jgi:hypothetical protein
MRSGLTEAAHDHSYRVKGVPCELRSLTLPLASVAGHDRSAGRGTYQSAVAVSSSRVSAFGCGFELTAGAYCRLRGGLSGIARGHVEPWCARVGLGELVHEPPARLVVGAVGAEETLVAAGEFLVAIRLERLDALVDGAAAAFVLETSAMEPVMRDAFGEPGCACSKLIQVRAEGRRATPS